MKTLHPILASYLPVVEGLARTFGDQCEAVLHDLTDVSASIVAIHNGQVSGRALGAPVTNLGLQFLRKNEKTHDFILNYKNGSIKDKLIKSSSIYIKDENQKVIGCLCINLDVTQVSYAKAVLEDITTIFHEEEKGTEKFANTISELMEQMIAECTKKVGKPIQLMNKEEKIVFIGMLDEMGLFLIKGAVQQIADLLDVSKYTIYNYLEKASNEFI